MPNWQRRIEEWRNCARVRTHAPASSGSVATLRQRVQDIPDELVSLLSVTNGLSVGAFVVLPAFEDGEVKRTWDSIQRANDPKVSRFLGRSKAILDRFLVFADVGAGRAAAFDRTDSSLWYEENGQLHQTDLTLEEFIEFLVREAELEKRS